MIQVLLIDDDIAVQNLIRVKLDSYYKLIFAGTLTEGRQFIQIGKPDIIVLDETLPDGLGTDFLEKLTHKYDIPVIMLTADKDIVSKRKAFLSGAVDYITKPFCTEELQLRIDARIKKVNENVKGDLSFDLKTQKVFVDIKCSETGLIKNTSIDLTPAEFKILFLLTERKETIFNRTQIIDSVWGKEHFIDERTIDQHISKIRKKLKVSEVFVKAKHGQGYYAIWP